MFITMCIFVFKSLACQSLAAEGGLSFHRTPELEMPAAHARRDNLQGGCLGSMAWGAPGGMK